MKTATVRAEDNPSAPTAVVGGLNQLLASSYALMVNTQFAHWHVEGLNFATLHGTFKQHYENLFAAVDELAERLRALDPAAIGSLSTFSSMAGVAEFTGLIIERDLVNGLIVGHRKVTADALALCDAASAAGDLETQDLAVSRIQWHEKTVWMLRNLLE
jgi:starvation-inducible DNA-binding protein